MVFSVILLIVLLVIALVGTFRFLLPEKRAAYLNPFWRRVHDFLTMKNLYLESILRTLYVISTVFTFVLCIVGGILAPFMMELNFGQTILGILLGLIIGALLAVILLFITRISYESIMLKVMLTDAAKKINQKMGGDGEKYSSGEPRRRLPSAPRPAVCRRCGTRFDPRRGYCPNCDERW